MPKRDLMMKLNKVIKSIVILTFLLVGCSSVSSVNPDEFQEATGEQACSTPAQYLVRFTAFWSALTHPQDFPGNPHFSSLIGATHSAAVQFWAAGLLASPGMEDMAELGRTSPLDDEIQAQINQGNAESIIRGDGINPSPGETSTLLDVSAAFSLVTLVSMIAPSPDWFVGVHDKELCGENGEWINQLVVELFPYDAGTDSGASYESPDADTDPPEPIRRLEEAPFLSNGSVNPMGTFTFTRVEN